VSFPKAITVFLGCKNMRRTTCRHVEWIALKKDGERIILIVFEESKSNENLRHSNSSIDIWCYYLVHIYNIHSSFVDFKIQLLPLNQKYLLGNVVEKECGADVLIDNFL
jgi:hypothetical protein